MPVLTDHPQRYELSNELHARPFPEIPGPCQAYYIALTLPEGAAGARSDLLALLDRHGAAHPPEHASHYQGALGRHRLKWEQHSEFVTYTLFADGLQEAPFSSDLSDMFPKAWLQSLGGTVITSARVRIERVTDATAVESRLGPEIRAWFVSESLAAAYVLDQNVVIAGDFRIDQAGHVRFAVFGLGDVGARRMGRVVQRMLEIETYKSMAMMTLPVARRVFGASGELDSDLADISAAMAGGTGASDAMLQRLLAISARVEALASDSAFRFSAGRAYRAIADQRIKVLREERIQSSQLFSEFMTRRFDPAMRTCEAAEKSLSDLSARAARAAELLATQVGVAAADQNRKLLESMNKRAALQMRLQETVEGLSVVAVSYYAVNLMAYLLTPLVKSHLSKTTLSALLVPPVILGVWWMIRRIKARVSATFDGQ